MGFAAERDSRSHAVADLGLFFVIIIFNGFAFSQTIIITINASIYINIDIAISFVLILFSILGAHFYGLSSSFCLISLS